MVRRSGRILAGLIVCLPNGAAAQQVAVQSILNRCIACHDGAKPMASLSLKTREAALQGGKSGPALAPGNADGSLLYKMVSARKMPPGNPLAERETGILKEWINSGAPWFDTKEPQRAGPDWWSLQPVVRPSVPAVKDSSW